jgi:hypothetical protein
MTEPSLPLAFLAAALLFCSIVASLSQRPRRLKLPSAPQPPPIWPVDAVLSLVQAVPFDQRSPREQQDLIERLRAVDQGPLSMREHGLVNLILAEIALQAGDREQARLRFRAALRWDPRLPIRRTLDRLENPTPLSFTSRRAA